LIAIILKFFKHNKFFQLTDTSKMTGDVGGSLEKQKELQTVISKGRQEIKQAQEKLNSSLTTPLADSGTSINSCIFLTYPKSCPDVSVKATATRVMGRHA